MNQHGEWITGDNLISEEAVNHFSNLFTTEGVTNLQHLDCIEQVITQDDNEALMVIPDEEEIRMSIFDMDPNSAPGPDGYGGSFYQTCWEIIKSDLVSVVQLFFSGAELTKFYTNACLVLIPKVENPTIFLDLRPLSLSNFSNKILSKIINNRLAPLLPKLISENQSGFIHGRLITENMLLAQEIIHGMKCNKEGGNAVIKLDMSKAYDRMDWTFLMATLRKFGFSEEWVDLIWRSISNVWYSIVINDSRKGFFHSTRGLK